MALEKTGQSFKIMAITINGTTGVAGVDGSNATPAIQGTDSNTGLSFGSDTVNINTGGSTRATINSSGKLIVGSTDDYAENVQAAFYGASNGGIALASGTSGLSRLMFADATSGNSGASVGSIIYAHSDNSLRFNINGGTERMRIDSSGNVGINKSNPSYPFVARRTDASGIIGEFANSSGYGLTIGQASASGEAYLRTGTGQALAFVTNSGSGLANERMRIDSSGRVGIGTNSPDYLFNVVSSANDMCRFQQTTNDGGSSYSMIFMKHAAARSGSNGIDITFQNDSGTTVGQIDHGQSTTQYRTSSDYRLKENAAAISDGITRLKTLKPYRFNWISEPDQPKVDGFFAHEVTPAVPEAISGTKDEVDSDNKPIYQGIDQSKLVPLLTAALQEAITKIETLETKVAALEAA